MKIFLIKYTNLKFLGSNTLADSKNFHDVCFIKYLVFDKESATGLEETMVLKQKFSLLVFQFLCFFWVYDKL
jgi:hypothetical protein